MALSNVEEFNQKNDFDSADAVAQTITDPQKRNKAQSFINNNKQAYVISDAQTELSIALAQSLAVGGEEGKKILESASVSQIERMKSVNATPKQIQDAQSQVYYAPVAQRIKNTDSLEELDKIQQEANKLGMDGKLTAAHLTSLEDDGRLRYAQIIAPVSAIVKSINTKINAGNKDSDQSLVIEENAPLILYTFGQEQGQIIVDSLKAINARQGFTMMMDNPRAMKDMLKIGKKEIEQIPQLAAMIADSRSNPNTIAQTISAINDSSLSESSKYAFIRETLSPIKNEAIKKDVRSGNIGGFYSLGQTHTGSSMFDKINDDIGKLVVSSGRSEYYAELPRIYAKASTLNAEEQSSYIDNEILKLNAQVHKQKLDDRLRVFNGGR